MLRTGQRSNPLDGLHEKPFGFHANVLQVIKLILECDTINLKWRYVSLFVIKIPREIPCLLAFYIKIFIQSHHSNCCVLLAACLQVWTIWHPQRKRYFFLCLKHASQLVIVTPLWNYSNSCSFQLRRKTIFWFSLFFKKSKNYFAQLCYVVYHSFKAG